MELRFKLVCPAILVTLSMAIYAQSPATRPQFDVASIKPDDGSSPRQGVGINASGTFTAQNVTVRKLITDAYDLRDIQVAGGPGWIESDRFDIVAKPPVRAGTEANSPEKKWAEAALMLQSLLEDRFQLKIHRETRDLPVYVLTVAKNGFRPQKQDCVTLDPDNPPTRPEPGQPLAKYCGNILYGRNGENRTLDGAEITMTQFVQYGLGNNADRMILDKTGLAGKYTFHLEWLPGDIAGSAQSSGPSLFTALEEQLGLKLESTKAPIEVLVVDQVAKPSAN